MEDIPDNEIGKNAGLDCFQLREIMQGISSIQSNHVRLRQSRNTYDKDMATSFSHTCAINALNRRFINGLFAFSVD